MSVKKKKTKKSVRTNHAKPDTAAIQKMVRDIPSLMLEEGFLHWREVKPEPPVAPIAPAIEEPIAKPTMAMPVVGRADRHWLWIGVGLCMTAIFGIWVFNVKTLFSDIKRRPSVEGSVVEQSKNDFRALLDTLKTNDLQVQRQLDKSAQTLSPETTEKEIKAVLESLATNPTKK